MVDTQTDTATHTATGDSDTVVQPAPISSAIHRSIAFSNVQILQRYANRAISSLQ